VIRKTRYDSFYGTFLENLLGFYGIKHLVVTSTAVNICVLHTAGSAALSDSRSNLLGAVSAFKNFDCYAAPRQASFLYKATLVKTTDNSTC